MKDSLEHRAILRSFSALIVILTTATVLLVGMGTFLYVTELNTSRRIDAFHLRTLVLLGEVEARILRTDHAYLADESGPTRELRPAITSIGQVLGSIQVLQEEHGGETYVRTLGRAQEHYEGILASIEEPFWDGAAFEERLDALGFTIHQLERLHAVALEDTLARISSARVRRARWSILGAGLVVVLTGAIVVRLFVLVRDRLREKEAMESALRESRAQLLQSQKLEALGTLVGGVAHDFNNILTTILGNVEGLLVGLDPGDPAHPGLSQIQKAGERAAGVVRQLLLFSRQEVGEPTVVDLGPLVRDLLPLLRRLIREDIDFELDLEESLGPVLAEPVQIEQVLINLTVNARDAMPAGGRLTIHGNARDIHDGEAASLGIDPGPYAHICVVDTGTGMTDEVRQRVFEPFFTTKPPGRGTGLGLSMVHGIVTSCDGGVLLHSEVGTGTTVDVYLPTCVAAGKPESAPLPAKPPGGNETVLLVEDEELVRSVADAALRGAGYEVVVAGDGSEAERLCRDHGEPIDLILTDVVMPGMRGPELVTRIQSLCPEARVVYMSGYSEPDLLERVEEAKSSFLPKPFRLQALLEVVRETLDESGPSELPR